jgi:3-oxosteroid 1-dehydrogenase
MTDEKDMTEPAKKGISRRQFIAGTVGGLVIGVAAGAAAGSIGFPTIKTQTTTETTTEQPGLPSSWDQSTDVVVVGSGGAGLSAAIGALESGAKVIVLEKAAAVGGTTGISGGVVWIPNTSLAKAAGITPTTDQVMSYYDAIGGGEQDDSLITTYLDQGPLWLDDLIAITNGTPTWSLSGSTNVYYNLGTLPKIVQGYQAGPAGSGAALIKAMKAYIDSKGATTLLSTAATSLYQDAAGRIVGVQATSNGSTINIAAAKGVILAAGGFDYDPTMLQNYQRGPIMGSGAVKTNTGDGVKMAQAVGAYLGNMNNNWGLPVYVTPTATILDWFIWRSKPGAIIVNSSGKRFVNESAAYPVANRAFLTWDPTVYGYPNIPAYTIMDATAFGKYGLAGASAAVALPSYITKADSIQDLATALNIDPTALQATITTFNQYAANGVDPDFNRGEFILETTTTGDPSRKDLKNVCLAPLATPPFYAAMISPGTCGTCGGPKINSNAQILDLKGNPIPGLYGAGNDISAPSGAGYPGGGGTVGPACVFGWIAGKSAGSST